MSISPWLVAEMRSHRARQDEHRLSLGVGRAPDDSTVFVRWNGEPLSPSRVSQDFAAVMDALEIDCTLHGLRHTHVSQLIAEGLDVLTISRRIGHASPSITLNVYGHMFPNNRRARRGHYGSDLCQVPGVRTENDLATLRWQFGGNRLKRSA